MSDLAESCQRKAFYPPQLVFLGSVKALTRGGGGSNSDFFSRSMMGMMGMMGMSDPRTKENIVEIGRDPRGFGLYLFDYKTAFRAAHGSARQFGVMADEVERVVPGAVSVAADGYRRVNYSLLGISRLLHP